MLLYTHIKLFYLLLLISIIIYNLKFILILTFVIFVYKIIINSTFNKQLLNSYSNIKYFDIDGKIFNDLN